MFGYDDDKFGNTVERRRAHRLAVEFYGALCTVAPGPEVAPSLDSCEQLPMSDAVPDFSDGSLSGADSHLVQNLQDFLRLGVDDVDRAVQLAQEAAGTSICTHLYQSPEDRRETALALIEQGEVSHASRYATCGHTSVQLECPDVFGAGGCGCDDNYAPITCSSPLCEDCARQRAARMVEKYTPVVRGMDDPTMLTLTIENVPDPGKGAQAIKGAFGRFRRRVIPTEGVVRREPDGDDEDEIVKPWVWWRDNGQPSFRWRPKLEDELARRWDKEYYQQGRGIPVDEIIKGGLYGIDIKQKGPNEYNVHLHAVVDMHFCPQPALASVWEDVSGAPVMDVRRIYQQGGKDAESAVLETVWYALKPPEFESVEDAAAWFAENKGSRQCQPFGELHGNTPDDLPIRLICNGCGETPNWWNFSGVHQQALDNMETVVGSYDGDRPPPGEE